MNTTNFYFSYRQVITETEIPQGTEIKEIIRGAALGLDLRVLDPNNNQVTNLSRL